MGLLLTFLFGEWMRERERTIIYQLACLITAHSRLITDYCPVACPVSPPRGILAS